MKRKTSVSNVGAKKGAVITSADFDAKFDAGDDVTEHLNLPHARRPGREEWTAADVARGRPFAELFPELAAAARARRQQSGFSTACYTASDIQQLLKMSRSTFAELNRAGKLPFLEELKPRLGRVVRYRADLVHAYLRGEWQRPRFGGPRRPPTRKEP